MKTVLHLFLKDVRQMRWTLALWLALLAVQLAATLTDEQSLLSNWDMLLLLFPKGGSHLPVWTVLHWMGLVVLVFQALLADRAFGTSPFWKTRPITRGQMATAKFLFVAIFTVLLPVVVELLGWRGQGISWRQTLGNAWLPLVGQAYVVSCMALVAAFCGRRTWEIIVFAVLAAAAPLALGMLYGSSFALADRIPGFSDMWRVTWESPPDYLMPSESFVLSSIFAMGLLPTVVLSLAGVFAYWLQRRARILQRLVILLLVWLATPVPLLMYRINTGKSQRHAPVHRYTALEAGLTLEWLAPLNTQARRPFAGLRAHLRLPELPAPVGPHTVMEPGYGYTTLRLSRAIPNEAGGYAPHFELPEQNPTRFANFVSGPDPDAYLNRSLTRTKGLLAAALGRFSVLNPVTPADEPRANLAWEADRPLTNFTHASPQWRVVLLESEARVVGRQPFAEYRRQHPVTNAEPPEAAADPRYTITLQTKNLRLVEQTGGPEDGWDTRAPRKVVLWHSQRRELLLSATSVANHRDNYGVLALSGLSPLSVLNYANHFPHTAKGKEPQPGAPGPEWFAEAEVIFIALRHLTNQHHIIEVPDVPLPPVEVKP